VGKPILGMRFSRLDEPVPCRIIEWQWDLPEAVVVSKRDSSDSRQAPEIDSEIYCIPQSKAT
jgi:hypothetical protein